MVSPVPVPSIDDRNKKGSDRPIQCIHTDVQFLSRDFLQGILWARIEHEKQGFIAERLSLGWPGWRWLDVVAPWKVEIGLDRACCRLIGPRCDKGRIQIPGTNGSELKCLSI